MKVLYVADPGSVGGAARALMEVVLQMKGNGIETIVCTSIHDSFNDELESCGIYSFACGHQSAMNTRSPYKWKRPLKYPYEIMRYRISLPKAVKSIEECVDLRSVDLIHTNSSRNDIGCIIASKHGIPHVMHIREFGQEDFDCICYRRNYYNYLNRHCNILLAISNAVRNSWVSKGIDESKTEVLYDGVDIRKIKQKTRVNKDGSDLKLVVVGGICEAKGQHMAIEAISVLPDDIKKNISLDLIGWSDPRYEKWLYELIVTKHIENNVRFLGERNDVYDILCNYDVGLMCSKSEGFGRVTAEYLYAGLGVIAANTGASPELVSNGETGLIYSQNDEKELAECIIKFYTDRDLLERCSKNAQVYARFFSAERNASEIFEIYQRLLRKSKRKRIVKF